MFRSLQKRLAVPFNFYLALALGLYISLVGILLLSSGFLPYVTDNSESFSMLVHARNMLNFGLGHALGLSDESYAIHPAGHPYVYTHQGNFPRVPVFLLLLLGVTKIEWQIVLLALVLGTATIYLCFRFFSRVNSPLFSFIVCATLTTDYLLFMQWEVNTFRVWHGLFFFLSLVCVQSINGLNQRKAALLLFFTFVGLFYFEIVFATFTLVMCICYALLTYWRRRLVLRVALLGAAGAALALCGLLAQSVAYLGWATAWQDIQLTFLNRNFYEQISRQAPASNTLEFFLKHHIVYWLDNPDTRGYLGVGHFLYIVAASVFSIDTPYLILVVWILTIAWVLRMGLHVRSGIRRADFPSVVDKSTEHGSLQSRALPRITWGLALLIVIYAAVSLALGFIVVELRGLLRPVNPDVVRIPVLHLVLAFPDRYRGILASLWLGGIQDYFGEQVLRAGLLGSIILALVVILDGGRRYLRIQNDQPLTEVLRYLATGSVAFAFTYALSPGYLWAGYSVRRAPLPVFILDIWIALFFYMLVVLAIASGREVAAMLGGEPSATARRRPFSAKVGTPHFVFALSLFLLTLGLVYWVRIQTLYTTAFPPTSFLALRELGQGKYRGSTFISNVYSAPIAYYTGNWAYMDNTVSENIYRLKSGKITQVIGGEYLWEADREFNSDYLHPQYYMCIVSPSLTMAADLVASRGRVRSNCSSQPLVRDAQAGVGPFSNVLVASDPSPGDMWAIVKLDPSIQFTRLR